MARLDVASKALHYQVLHQEGQVLGFQVFEKGVVQSNSALTLSSCHPVTLSFCHPVWFTGKQHHTPDPAFEGFNQIPIWWRGVS